MELCDARASRCRCAKPAGHVKTGDAVHACHPDRCSGQWVGVQGTSLFQVVALPFPVGQPRPWDEDDTDG